jgi:integrase
MKITTATHLDTRRVKENDVYPVKLRVTYLRQRKYYNLDIDLSKENWEKINSAKPRGELKETKIKLALILEKADKVIKDMEDFSFHKFEKDFFKIPKNTQSIKASFEEYISRLEKDGRISTASSYQTALNSLLEFKSNLKFWDITSDFLQDYENWMLKKGCSITTVGIYLRSLRTLINNAIEDGGLKREFYPFGKRKYQIPNGHNVKKALEIEDILKIYNYDTLKGSPEERAKDFWFFSYLANGMNIKDICRLKYSNIQGDKMVFIRSKTERTKRANQKPIVVILTDELNAIIEKWGNENKPPESYIFSILFEGITPKRERELVQLFTKTTNKWIGRIAKDVGISKKVTTYSARHSYCTILKNYGAPTEFISDSVGHGSGDVTQNYFDKYTDEIKRKWASALLPIKSPALVIDIAV